MKYEDIVKNAVICLSKMKIEDTTFDVARNIVIDEYTELQEKHDILKHTLEANIEHQKKLKEENTRLNKELEIYKLRHKLALKKLNSAMKHYDLEDKNNTIKFCKEILEGQGIEERCHKMLRGDKE